MRILIGTNNAGKAKEFRDLLVHEGFAVMTLADLDIPSVEETGVTFAENAEAKAVAYAAKTGLITVADDGGLEIDALDGAPGVYSRRWTGDENASDEALAAAVISHMAGVPDPLRTARLRTVVTIAYPDGRTFSASEAIDGHIETSVDLGRITPGYPYRALFRVTALDKLFCDLTQGEHEMVNHRRAALLQLLPKLKATEAIALSVAGQKIG